MYERDACFVPQEGKIVKGTKNIRETVKSIINMNCKIESKVNRVIQTSNIAPVDTEWSFNCIRPDGKLVTITRKAPDLLRKQLDSKWRILIDNLWQFNLGMSV